MLTRVFRKNHRQSHFNVSFVTNKLYGGLSGGSIGADSKVFLGPARMTTINIMDLLAKILASDPTTPRLTIYDENTGARLDFSGITLDNWAAKIANMLIEELDLTEDSLISIDLPPGWQAVAIALGALAAGIPVTFFDAAISDVVFVAENAHKDATENAAISDAASPSEYSGDVVIVTNDPFGRGVEETGGTLLPGAIDFGPTVRFYGDQFTQPTRSLANIVADALPQSFHRFSPTSRVLVQGWADWLDFVAKVLAPLAADGSVVVATGNPENLPSERLERIADIEKVSERLP